MKSYNTIHKNNKDAEIKIRVSKEQKKELQEKAKLYGKTLSSYILNCCMDDKHELLQLIPDAVELWNLVNELYRSIESASNARVTELEVQDNHLSTYIQKNNPNWGGIYDDTDN
ncbi:MAG: DUF1778 domain-containing protein [Lachnospiraceae bacterium]|nr:DUF1778 domain-containing protein [Lachnospiraceae bacterium]